MPKTVFIGKVISDLKMLKGSFRCVNKDIAPNQDKGIYFEKAIRDLDNIIKKYENLKEVKRN